MKVARRAKGEGSLYQARDKSWVYQYNEDGARKTKRFRKKSDAKLFIRSLAAEESPEKADTGIQRSTEPAPSKDHGITLGDWLDRWLEHYARPTVKPSTYCSYELYIRGHVKPLLGQRYLRDLTVDDLQDFFNDRRENGNLKGEGGLSPKTLLNMRNMLHFALAQAMQNRLLPDNPVEGVRIPRAEKKEMRVLDRDEQNKLIATALDAEEPAAFGIIFDLFTGIRLGELCGLRWENVQMDEQTFRVCETRNRLPNHDESIDASTSVQTLPTTKTDSSRRTVYLLDELYQDLIAYKAAQDALAKQYPGYNAEGYVFCQPNGQPYEPRTYHDLFKRCVKRAGIRDANFHALRHTFATRSLEQGMDVVTLSRLLGHANPSITMDKYGHALEDHKRSSVQKLGQIYGKPSQRGAER